MNHINLTNTKVEGQYKGAGHAFLVMEDGAPTKLIYENPEYPAVSIELSDDELMEIFINNEVDFEVLERKQAVILMGTCSCYQFAFPEVFIDFKDETLA
ncbi:hypothetical protein P4597_18975 [Peribacillus simplex]|uniref:hypothetical protein n=1 Tax=Peribacillus simplex TaxID=1478 RepID=UPI002E1AA19D|nr:hypothetical protein [Peribacillus simplex]